MLYLDNRPYGFLVLHFLTQIAIDSSFGSMLCSSTLELISCMNQSPLLPDSRAPSNVQLSLLGSKHPKFTLRHHTTADHAQAA